MEQVEKLSKDIKKAAQTLDVDELRLIVDNYYTIQQHRIRCGNQENIMSKTKEPHELFTWYKKQNATVENEIKKILQYYTLNHPVGQWLNMQMGIGPVISAGLLAHIDIEKAPTVGHIYSFAGLVSDQKWEKGQKRPWNAKLKTLCWQAGQGFIKTSNKVDSFYGRIYRERKEWETQQNELLAYKDLASEKAKVVGKKTEAYKYYSVGKLPPAHINARASRFAVKIFLSHLHEYWYEWHFKKPAPEPYAIAHLKHVHKIKRPEFNPELPQGWFYKIFSDAKKIMRKVV